jgi:hypothetical protein
MPNYLQKEPRELTGLDFMDLAKKVALQKLYSANKELNPLQFNKIDKFVSKIENEINIIGNAVILVVLSFKSRK